MSTATTIAIACGVGGFVAMVFCFMRVQRGLPRTPLTFEVKLGCIFGWLLWAGAMCFTIAALLQLND
jgi:hypothetical protein